MISIRETLATAAAGWCLSLALPASVAGQVAVGGTLALSTQAAGASDSPYLGPGFGGTHLGSVVSLDVDVGRTISAGAEFSTAGDISGSQEERVGGGSNSLLSEHHDTVASAVVKFKVPTTTRLHVVGMGGFGFARRQTERTGTFRSNVPPFVTTPVTEHLSDAVLAVTGGVDGVVAIHRGLGILALFRLHVLADDDRLPDGVVHRGVSSVILRYGVGAQVRF